MNITITWYLVGAGLWMFATGIGYAFAGGTDRRTAARAFFAFPIWPVALVALMAIAAARMWKAAAWGVTRRGKT